MRLFVAALALGALLFSGCSCGQDTGGDGADAGKTVLRDDAGHIIGLGDAGVPGADAGGFCSEAGPTVIIGQGTSGSYDECTGQIAETTFIAALCTCGDTSIAGYLQTRAFDSSQGPYDPSSNQGGGAVGVNGSYTNSIGYNDIGGSLSIAGPDSLDFFGYLKIRGDLRLEGTATIPGETDVGRDGWMGAAFTDWGPVNVTRDLHHASTVFGVPVSVGGSDIPGSVTVPPPCPCSASDLIDVASLVSEAKTDNDNAKLGLATGALANVFGSAEITLPCGRYYLDGISGLGGITVHVAGRVALFIGGDINATGVVSFDMGQVGEIDIFVAGDLVLTGSMSFGDQDRPAATRIYVASSKDVTLVGVSGFVGNLYAPRSKVTALGGIEVYGSVVAGSFAVPGLAEFVYDRAVTSAGKGCPPPKIPGACRQCGVCTGGAACINSQCTACTADEDCCGQDVCTQGKCNSLVY